MTLKEATNRARNQLAFGYFVDAGRPYIVCGVCGQKVDTITNNHLGEKPAQAIKRRLIEHLRADCEKD